MQWLLSAFAAGVLLLSGCSSFRGAPDRLSYSKDTLSTVDQHYAETLESYYREDDEDRRKDVRNKFIDMRSAVIDAQYHLYRQALYEERVRGDVATDLATLGINATGAAVNGTSAKTALHALSGGVIGAKASVDKHVYFDRALPALLAQMDAQRNAVKLTLLDGMQSPTAKYPLSQARFDLERYYDAGTIPGGISGITGQAVAEQAASAKKVDERMTANEIREKLQQQGVEVGTLSRDAAGEMLFNCTRLKTASPNQANIGLLRQWMAENKVGEKDIVTFLADARYKKQREAAAAALRSRFADC